MGAGTAQYAAEPFTLVLKHPAVLRMLLLGRDQLETLQLPLREKLAALPNLLRLPFPDKTLTAPVWSEEPLRASPVKAHSRAENTRAIIERVLKPGGLFLNHGITHDVEGWDKTLCADFINRYVFPDGELDTFSIIAGFRQCIHCAA